MDLIGLKETTFERELQEVSCLMNGVSDVLMNEEAVLRTGANAAFQEAMIAGFMVVGLSRQSCCRIEVLSEFLQVLKTLKLFSFRTCVK